MKSEEEFKEKNTKNSIKKSTKLLSEKLRPKSIDKMILYPRIKQYFEDDSIPQNMIFYGSSGLGKTTLAKIIANKYNYLYINMSKDNSINILRTKIENFSKLNTNTVFDEREHIDDSIKVILLDEIDGATPDFFNALRATIEEYSSYIRFIGTCNDINKIPSAIESRMLFIPFDPQNSSEVNFLHKNVKNKINSLFKKLNINIENDTLDYFLNRNLPDIRKIYEDIQSWIISDIDNITEDIIKTSYTFKDLYSHLLDNKYDTFSTYKIVMGEYQHKTDDVLQSLGNDFINYLVENNIQNHEKYIADIVIIATEHQYMRSFVIDKSLNLIACLLKIKDKILSSKN